jgi:hypothetical protein
MVDVQPASHAKYGLYGMPFFSKNFSYATSYSDDIQEHEMYFSRLQQIRKNFLTNFSQTPYLIYNNSSFQKDSVSLANLFNSNQTTLLLYFFNNTNASNNLTLTANQFFVSS